MKKAILYVHGKEGSYREAEQYKNHCLGFDIIGVDYNEYLPWSVEKEIKLVYSKIKKNYDSIYILANSIGAYFAMHSLQNSKIDKALFISPIVDMEKLINDMLGWINITEQELEKKQEISTDFGETLSWKFLSFVRNNPIHWKIPTEILYAEYDNLTSRETIDEFTKNHNAHLTVMKGGEHWFHKEEELNFLNDWLKNSI